VYNESVLTEDTLAEAEEWIKKVLIPQHSALTKARALVSEDQWATYAMLYTEEDLAEFQEVKVWNDVRYTARIMLRARPILLRNRSHKKKKV
jgi:hypothetical protein